MSKIKRPSKQEAEAFMYDAIVRNHIWLSRDWAGWRMAGRDLVSPDGDRMNARELRWILALAAQKKKLWAQVKDVRQDNVVAFVPRAKAVGE